MNFKRYYQHQCYSMFGILQLHKIWAICINIQVAITKDDPLNSIVIRVDIRNKTWYNLDIVVRITVGINVYGIFNVVAFVVDVLIQKSIWISSSDVLSIIFDEIALHSHQQSEFECDYRNNDHTAMVINNYYRIHATPILGAFLVDICHFILSVMDTLSLNIELPIEFEAFVAAIGQLMLNFAVPRSVDTVGSHKQVRHNVCAVFIFAFLFSFVCNFECVNVVLLIKYVYNTLNIQHNIHGNI